MFGTLAISLAALWGLGGRLATPKARGSALAALLALSVFGTAWLEPDMTRGLRDAWAWLGKSERFQSTVVESMSLLAPTGRFTTALAVRRLSWLFALYPLVLALMLRQPFAFGSGWQSAFFVYWSCAWLTLAALQQRFLDTFAVPYAIACGWGIATAVRLARAQRWPRSALATLAGAVALLLLPLRHDLGLWLGFGWDGLRGVPPRLPSFVDGWKVTHEVALWIREHTPETRGFLDPAERPEYGVLAGVNEGHVITYAARRPTLVDNFGAALGGDIFQLVASGRIWDEEGALGLRDSLGVRYVMVGAAWDPATLKHHRLLHESRPLDGREPLLRVYERVAGARLQGTAAAGAEVRASLALDTARGKRLRWRTSTTAVDRDWELVIPYPTQSRAEGGEGEVRAASRLVVDCGGRAWGVMVSEAAVREGARIEGPHCDDEGAELLPTPQNQ
jgi:asparagine N-glycosylation enzyme membrane subunit Stt3